MRFHTRIVAVMSFVLGVLLGGVFLLQVDASPSRAAGAPDVVSFQAQILDGGIPFSGTGYFKFAVVNAIGDTTYWSNDGSSVGGAESGAGVPIQVDEGLLLAMLGDSSLTNMSALPASAFNGLDRYLRIWFSPDGLSYTLLSPDQRFASVPYAMQAQDAATLDGLDSTAFYTQAQVDALLIGYDDRISDLEDLLASVSLENGGDDLVFTDVNVHVRSGSGATAGAVNGRGNLIIGYDEDPGSDAVRGGSHNLVIGPDHSYPNYGGFVAGQSNTISGIYATVSGGMHNIASGEGASIQGGGGNDVSYGNTAGGKYSSVSGGRGNQASGPHASINGGVANQATEFDSSICGGFANIASGSYSAVCGGEGNEAGGTASSVGGGHLRSALDLYDWAAGALFQDD
jgi:hypothetical protein